MARLKINTDNLIVIEDNKEVTEMRDITNLKEFAEAVAESINERQNKYEATVEYVVKLNDNRLYGVKLKAEDCDAAPTLYLEEAYEDFNKGWVTVDEVGDSLIARANSAIKHAEIPDEMFDFRFDDIVDRLSVRIGEIKRNTEFFNNTAFKEDMDGLGLGMVADINFGDYRTTVTEQLMERFSKDGHTKNELITKALGNAPKINPPILSDMMNAALQIPNNHLDDEDFEWNDGDVFVLTTRSMKFGACALFYSGVIDRLAEMFRVGFYIIPSSVHEVLIVPDSGDRFTAEALKLTLLGANSTVLADEDILSDNVWYYDYTFNTLGVAA